jgi:hypothetical protein
VLVLFLSNNNLIGKKESVHSITAKSVLAAASALLWGGLTTATTSKLNSAGLGCLCGSGVIREQSLLALISQSHEGFLNVNRALGGCLKEFDLVLISELLPSFGGNNLVNRKKQQVS